jgi:hypothetical protein
MSDTTEVVQAELEELRKDGYTLADNLTFLAEVGGGSCTRFMGGGSAWSDPQAQYFQNFWVESAGALLGLRVSRDQLNVIVDVPGAAHSSARYRFDSRAFRDAIDDTTIDVFVPEVEEVLLARAVVESVALSYTVPEELKMQYRSHALMTAMSFGVEAPEGCFYTPGKPRAAYATLEYTEGEAKLKVEANEWGDLYSFTVIGPEGCYYWGHGVRLAVKDRDALAWANATVCRLRGELLF